MIYNDLEGKDGRLLRGEIILALRIILAQARWRRLFGHMTVPVSCSALHTLCQLRQVKQKLIASI